MLALMLTVASAPALAEAETSSVTTTSVKESSDVLSLIQSLMKKIEELQKQLTSMRGEIQALRSGLREGVENDDVKKIQELLATDPTIYPKGKVTGYYGPLTKEAILAFQKKHGLPETGEVDEATKKLLEEYLKKKTDKHIAPGWMKAPGLAKKIEDKKWYDSSKNPATTEANAKGMIEAATNVIADLKDKIEDAEDDADADESDIEDAKEDLARAEAELEKAKDYMDDKEYQKAYDVAYKAKKSAYAGLEEIKDVDSADMEEKAEDMIDLAEAAIEDLEDMIEDAEEDDVDASDLEDAKEDLARAKTELEDAEDFEEDEEYQKAYDEAYKAKLSAYAGKEELN